MKLFVDTANMAEIIEANSWGILDGVTTNPSLVAREGVDLKTHILRICDIVDGPVSAETVQPLADDMIKEAHEISKWHPNVHVKVPMTKEGMKCLKVLSEEGIKTNVTLVFTANQAILAAKNGATFVSVFLGRVDDIGGCGMDVVRQCVDIFQIHGFESQVLAASIRSALHVTEAAVAGADISTVPFKFLEQMFHHPLTDSGIERFNADWAKAQAALKGAKKK
jgi:transaldolase